MVSTPEPYAGDTTRSPVVVCAIGSIVCAIVSVGILVFYVPRPGSLAWASGFLAASAALLLAALVSLLRRRPFAWRRFFTVARWVLLLNSGVRGHVRVCVRLRRCARQTSHNHDYCAPAHSDRYPDSLGVLGRPPRADPQFTMKESSSSPHVTCMAFSSASRCPQLSCPAW